MATPSKAPFPYYSARTDQIEPVRAQRSCYFLYENEMSLAAIDDHPKLAWERLNLLFPNSKSIEPGYELGAPARMELFWNDAAGKRGIVFFDGYGKLIVHVLNALLGYRGDCPDLTEQIMTRLGVPMTMYYDITKAVQHQRPYKVVVSRERTTTKDDVLFIRPTSVVAPRWQWHRVH